MSVERAPHYFMPWAGLALGTTGFFLAHQIGSDSTFQDCRFSSPLMVVVGTVVGLTVVALGAFGSWRVYARDGEPPGRRFVATIGLLACALFAIGIVLSLVAAMVIPRCWS